MRLCAWISAALILSSGSLTWADPPATSVDPVAESRRIEAEILKLSETETGKAFDAINKKFEALADKETEARKVIHDEHTKLVESPAGKAYLTTINELRAKQQEKWEIERSKIAQAAKELYAARHAELRKRAAGDLTGARKLGLDALTYPNVDGSTSAHPLGVILACRVLGVEYAWAYPEPSGYAYGVRPNITGEIYLGPSFAGAHYVGAWDREDYNAEFYLAAARAYARIDNPSQKRIAMLINSVLAKTSTTHDAYNNVVTGVCDLNLTARAPSEDELRFAREKGVKLALVPIAKDALVFIVNTRNPVKNLSRQQIVDIYEHKITDWKDAGWEKPESSREKITPIWRERNSGSRELFDAMIMKGRPAPDEKKISKLYSSGMGGPFSRATVESNVLAHSVYYYEHFMAASAFTRNIAVDGVEPTYETISNGTYPLISPVYVAYREGSPKDSPAMKLLAWLQTDEGQSVVHESGYVPVKAGK